MLERIPRKQGTELHRIATELTPAVPRVNTVVRQGSDIAVEILEQIAQQSADLVIMRTHGRMGIERVVLGSVTQKVLADAAVPIMLLRPGGHRITRVRKLLIPVDGSPGGTLALGTAVALSRATGASVKLLEVSVPASTWVYAGDAYGGMSFYDPVWDEEALAGARAYVDGVVARVRAAKVDVEGEARQEPLVADAIVKAADAADADLIVMSTRALTGPARALLGSTADAVVRMAHCPVLLIHPTDGKEDSVEEFELDSATESVPPPA
jgi:nucleotide-binding universal stress UspA family protein